MSEDRKTGDVTTFGASIIPRQLPGATRSSRAGQVQDPPFTSPKTTYSNVATVSSEPFEKAYPVTSPFYEHPAPSIERFHVPLDGKSISNVYDKDIESGMATPVSTNADENPFSSKISVDCNKECAMWPSKQTLEQTRKANKKKRHDLNTCAPVRDLWMHLSRKQRLLVKVILVLLIVGLVVGISVGVSKAVNGGVYATDGSSRPVARGIVWRRL